MENAIDDVAQVLKLHKLNITEEEVKRFLYINKDWSAANHEIPPIPNNNLYDRLRLQSAEHGLSFAFQDITACSGCLPGGTLDYLWYEHGPTRGPHGLPMLHVRSRLHG